jgi:hypothetical protein
LAAEGGQLGDAQACLKADQKERAVAPSDPGGEVWGVEKGVDLPVSEELHDSALEALARDREDALAEERVGWIREGDVAEEGVKRRETRVAAAGGIAALALEVVEELAEESGVEIGQFEVGGGTAQPLGRESEEQPEGIAVGGYGVRAGPSLCDQAVGEEGLEKPREVGGVHCASF